MALNKTLDKFLGDVIKHNHPEVQAVETSISSVSAKNNSVFSTVEGGSANWDSAYATTSGGSYIPADSLAINYSPVNYSAFSSDVSGHLSGIDAQLGISITDIIALGAASGDWNAVYSTVLAGSASWDSAYSSLLSNSGFWNNVYSTVLAGSASWDSVFSTVDTNSANWNSAYATTSGGGYTPADDVQVDYSPVNYTTPTNDVSGNFNGLDTRVGVLDTDINNVLGIANNNAVDITNLAAATGDYLQNTGDTMSGNLDMNGNSITNVDALCATAIYSVSAFTLYQDIIVSELSGFSVSGDVDVLGNISITGDIITEGGNSNGWNSNYSTVSTNSANWNEIITATGDIINLSAAISGESLWDRNGTTLSPQNAGDGISIDAGATFNTVSGDNDFTINKFTSGVAYKYDAGLDSHNFYGLLEKDATENAVADNTGSHFRTEYAPSGNQASTIKNYNVWNDAYATGPNDIGKVWGNVSSAYSDCAGLVENLIGAEMLAYQESGTCSKMVSMYAGAEVDAGTVTGVSLYDTWAWIAPGTVTNLKGLNICDLYGDGATNRYGIYINDSTGSATNDYAIYSENTAESYLAGGITISGDVTIPALTGDNTIVKSDSNGKLLDTTMSITDGPSGGSIINVIEFSTDPLTSELVIGDMWIVDSPSTSGKLWKYWDGTDKYSVEMSKE